MNLRHAKFCPLERRMSSQRLFFFSRNNVALFLRNFLLMASLKQKKITRRKFFFPFILQFTFSIKIKYPTSHLLQLQVTCIPNILINQRTTTYINAINIKLNISFKHFFRLIVKKKKEKN